MSTFQDHLNQIKLVIREIQAEDLPAFRKTDGAIIIDVREKEEHVQGIVPGAVLIPRGLLELKIEKLATDKDTPIAVYCAGGIRSALAAHS